MKGLPGRIYVQVDSNADGTDEDLLAWRNLSAVENGRIAVYVINDELDKREAVELRRKGTKVWFKASGK